jgi:hypothetical protein
MKRTIIPAMLTLLLGVGVGTFLTGPMLTSAATAADKRPQNSKKGKCVGVSAVVGKQGVTIFRAFEDGTVEVRRTAELFTNDWSPPRK